MEEQRKTLISKGLLILTYFLFGTISSSTPSFFGSPTDAILWDCCMYFFIDIIKKVEDVFFKYIDKKSGSECDIR